MKLPIIALTIIFFQAHAMGDDIWFPQGNTEEQAVHKHTYELLKQLNEAKDKGHLETVEYLHKKIDEHFERAALQLQKQHQQQQSEGHTASSVRVVHGGGTKAKL